jgi:hypothetical protein
VTDAGNDSGRTAEPGRIDPDVHCWLDRFGPPNLRSNALSFDPTSGSLHLIDRWQDSMSGNHRWSVSINKIERSIK